MKYIISILLLSAIAYSTPVHFDIEYIHYQNTESQTPIIYEPKPIVNEIYITTPQTTMSPTIVTPQTSSYFDDSKIIYDTNNKNTQNILFPPVVY